MQTPILAAKRLQQMMVWLLVGVFSSVAIATLPTPSRAQTYSDIQDHWAQSCIEQLAAADIVSGYLDNSFRPDQAITRAEYAALLNQAFPEATAVRGDINFRDVATGYWGYDAIQTAYQKGFLSGYPDQVFRPDQLIKRAEAFVALANGLNFAPPQNPAAVLQNTFIDAPAIPAYATDAIAAGVEKGIVVSAPQPQPGALMSPEQAATRSQVAAALCQVKFSDSLVPTAYLVAGGGLANSDLPVRLGQTCSNPVAGYSVQYPENWVTNQGEVAQRCRYFDPEELTLPERAETFDEAINLRTDAIPYDRIVNSENMTEEILTRQTGTIDGRQALITEAETNGRGLLPAGIRNYTYVVDLGESIFVGATYGIEDQQYARNKQVLDLMMASLSFTR